MIPKTLEISTCEGSLRVPFVGPDVAVLKSILTLIKAGWLKPYPTIREEGEDSRKAAAELAAKPTAMPSGGGLIKEKIYLDGNLKNDSQ